VVSGHVSEEPKGNPLIRPVDPPASVSSRKATAVFNGCRDRVDKLLDANADRRVVDSTIDAYALDRDEKDALWLWSHGRRPCSQARSAAGRQRSAMSEADGHD
jgi:hypothetical protein